VDFPGFRITELLQVRNLIEKNSQPTASRSESKLPLIRIKVINATHNWVQSDQERKSNDNAHIVLQVDYSGFSTINPQRFGQKYVGKVPKSLIWYY